MNDLRFSGTDDFMGCPECENVYSIPQSPPFECDHCGQFVPEVKMS